MAILPSVIAPTSKARSVLTPQIILPSTDPKNSYYCIITKRTYNSKVAKYEIYLQVAKTLLNDL